MSNKNTWIALIALIIIVIVASFLLAQISDKQPGDASSSQNSSTDNNQYGRFLATGTYRCDGGKTIQADFYNIADKGDATSFQVVGDAVPPTPVGVVILALSDGKTYKLSQTISADGGRYSNPDGSLVFWDKGSEALIMKNNQMDLNYRNCKAVFE